MDADEALELCQEVLELIEEIDFKKAGNPDWDDFSEGVKETAENMQSWIEENDHCTGPQSDALHNMKRGVSRWQR